MFTGAKSARIKYGSSGVVNLGRIPECPSATTTKSSVFHRTSTEIELKAAFRKLAMQHHPDRNPGDKECEHRFKEINEAYDVLKDGDKRAAYDRFGHAAFEHGGVGGHGFGADFGSAFADIFEGIFGMGSARAAGGPAASAAPTCATTWKSASTRPLPAKRRKSAFRPR